MLMQLNGKWQAGEADILCILRLPGEKYHVAIYEEHPLPGSVEAIDSLEFLRLKSKMHHTLGNDTLAEAQSNAAELRKGVTFADSNVYLDAAITVEDPVGQFIVPNWTRKNCTLEEALRHIGGRES